MKTKKVILSDNNIFFREAFRNVISDIKNVKVVGCASNGKELLELLKNTKADIVFTDIYMPVMNGFDAIEIIKNEYPEVLVIAFSSFEQKCIIDKTIQHGANGYLSKCRDNFSVLYDIFSSTENRYYFSNELNVNINEYSFK